MKNCRKLIFCVRPEQLLSHISFGRLHYYEVTLVKKWNKPLWPLNYDHGTSTKKRNNDFQIKKIS